MNALSSALRLKKSLSDDISVLCPKSEIFGFFIMRILIEYMAICVKMLARRIFMRSLVFIKPVARPVSAPIVKTKTRVSAGFMPRMISMAVTAPPAAKLPSTVISAIFNILKVKYTPSVISPHKIPCDTAPSIASKTAIATPTKKLSLSKGFLPYANAHKFLPVCNANSQNAHSLFECARFLLINSKNMNAHRLSKQVRTLLVILKR